MGSWPANECGLGSEHCRSEHNGQKTGQGASTPSCGWERGEYIGNTSTCTQAAKYECLPASPTDWENRYSIERLRGCASGHDATAWFTKSPLHCCALWLLAVPQLTGWPFTGIVRRRRGGESGAKPASRFRSGLCSVINPSNT